MGSTEAMKGLRPWNLAGLQEVIEHCSKLRKTPKDDWELGKHGVFSTDESTGKVSGIRFNMFAMQNQIMFFLTERYPDSSTFRCHAFRFMQIQMFLDEHFDQLAKDEFIVRDEPECAVSEALLESLCILPYEERRRRMGQEELVFSYDKVIQKARELDEDAASHAERQER